jgi:hypothetical protein
MTTPDRAYALSGSTLVSFNPAAPAVGTSIPVTGLTAGQTLVGIDFRPANGVLYGLGVNSAANTATLYTISVLTGVATVVGSPPGGAPLAKIRDALPGRRQRRSHGPPIRFRVRLARN